MQEEVNDMCRFEKYLSEEEFTQMPKKKNVVICSILPEVSAKGKNGNSAKCFSLPEVLSHSCSWAKSP